MMPKHVKISVPRQLADEIKQWAEDEKELCLTDTAYQRDLDNLLKQLNE